MTDYCLYRENGEVLAVVEAKKTSIDVRLAETQLTHYVTETEKHQSSRPFGFLANGLEIYFVDVGYASRREVFGFFTREDLENLLYIRRYACPLDEIEINNKIVDRAYQHEAIRRVGEAFAIGRRKALIVLATGTGKTRTTMGLIDVFMRSNQARRVLFVADRDPLVQQALEDGFQKYIPEEPRTRLHSWEIEKYWVNSDDQDIVRFLALYTFLPMTEIELVKGLEGHELNACKSVLAFEITAQTHGVEQALAAFHGANRLFGPRQIPPDLMPSSRIPRVGEFNNAVTVPTLVLDADRVEAGISVIDLLVDTGLCTSKSAARRLVVQGGAYLDQGRIDSIEQRVGPDQFADGGMLLKAGKKKI